MTLLEVRGCEGLASRMAYNELEHEAKAQYTPPMPTQLNCRVELTWRCVLNSQLIGASLDESEQFADNEVELRHVGDVNAAVASNRGAYFVTRNMVR